MEACITSRPGLTVAGVVLPVAFRAPYLIMYAWVQLCAQAGRIPGVVDASTLYGVWFGDPEKGERAYLVGFQVADASRLPEGFEAVDIPAGRCIEAVHRGNIGEIGAAYGALDAELTGYGHESNGMLAVEVYDTRQTIDDDYELPIYMPVR